MASNLLRSIGLVSAVAFIPAATAALAQVDARDSVFSTGADGSAPLFRIDDRGRARDLADRILYVAKRGGRDRVAA